MRKFCILLLLTIPFLSWGQHLHLFIEQLCSQFCHLSLLLVLQYSCPSSIIAILRLQDSSVKLRHQVLQLRQEKSGRSGRIGDHELFSPTALAFMKNFTAFPQVVRQPQAPWTVSAERKNGTGSIWQKRNRINQSNIWQKILSEPAVGQLFPWQDQVGFGGYLQPVSVITDLLCCGYLKWIQTCKQMSRAFLQCILAL